MAKKSLKNKDFSANCKQTAEISWFRTLIPPNKYDLGAKIQILNPNAPNYLLDFQIGQFLDIFRV